MQLEKLKSIDGLMVESIREKTFLKNLHRHNILYNILRTLNLSKESVVLDFGSGDSLFSVFLKQYGINCINYEPHATDEQLDYYKEKEIKVITCEKLLKKSAPFDVIILSEVIEHISVPKPTFDLLKLISLSETFLVLSTPNYMRLNMWLSTLRRRRAHPVLIKDWMTKINDYQTHCREFTGLEIKEMLQIESFKDIKINYHEIDYVSRNFRSLENLKSSNFLIRLISKFFPSMRNTIFAIAKRK
jgi:2-polyprenyl-3-methyl-5-hydroxy-6-metoxy-1,4-benzoquinol methylase